MSLIVTALLICLLSTSAWTQSNWTYTRRACERSTLHIGCAAGSHIHVISASYGRHTGRSICPKWYIWTTNCHASSSLGTVRYLCDGHQSCSVQAANSLFGDPCGGTYKYLEVTYQCL